MRLYGAEQQVDPYRPSLLAMDIARGDVVGAGDNTVLQLLAGAAYDTRDHEVVPSRGIFADASLRGSAGKPFGADHEYGGANVTLRGYMPVSPPYAVLALRAMGDALAGDVPVYLLSRAAGIATIQAPAGKTASAAFPRDATTEK
ncbi:MAG: BamA/TamA family outer membrane protein [Deltaproteobacteria bacterium]|nr:BamA/TamA family outer membrane protein [Deltaproteobacteria bacterium]